MAGKFKARELTWADSYRISRIVKALELPKDFGNLAGGNAQEVGIQVLADLVITAAENLGNAEKELNTFLASVAEVEVADIEAASLADIVDLGKQIVANEGLTSFLDSLTGSDTETSTTS